MTFKDLLPADEEARLHSLHNQGILNSRHESIFEAFAELTANVFSLPISLISVTDAAETVYIANRGVAGLHRQPRAEAICAMVVREDKAVVLTDLTQLEPQRLTAEARAATQGGQVQFYAGVPLRMPDQRSIGTLCVVDHQPRIFSAQEQQLLEIIAALIARIIVVRGYCLAQGQGEAHWQEIKALLAKQIESLNTLVRHVITRSGVRIPVVPQILGPVMQRLHEVDALLDDYEYVRS